MSKGLQTVIIIASRDEKLRRNVSEALQEIYAIREAATLDELNQILEECSPSVMLLDLALLGGIFRKLMVFQFQESLKVIILSNCASEEEQVLAIKTGATGYCNCNIDPALLRRAIETVQKGEIWAGRRVITHLLKEIILPNERTERTQSINFKTGLHDLTSREREIAISIGKGASNKEIAQRLNISEATVKAHLTAIFRKLRLSGRLGLALLVSEQNMPTASV